MWKLIALLAIGVIGPFLIWGGTTLALRDDPGGGAGTVSGEYPSAISIPENGDPDGHDCCTGMPDNLTLFVEAEGPNIAISANPPFVDVQGTLTGDNFSAFGQGTVAGFPNVQVQFDGAIVGGELNGLYMMGTNDELPDSNDDGTHSPVTYEFEPKPPEKTYTITVLKQDKANLQGIPNWEINLYLGLNCNGDLLDSGDTDANGLIEFGVDDPGQYSVEEKGRSGWNPVGDECENILLPGVAGAVAGLPVCPVNPDQPFPDAGCDEFNSVATVRLNFNDSGIEPLDCDLSGPTQIERSAVVTQPAGDYIDTELVAMELTGSCGATVTQSPDQQSTGRITEQSNGDEGTLEFSADSFFDIFFEVDIPGATLHNEDPLHMECKIDEIPPYGCFYEPDVGVIDLYDEDDEPVGELIHARHIPIGPKDALVIFTNERKGSPTPPPDKDYLITVLKRDKADLQGIPGWEINLYGGSGCLGTPIASGSTDANGLIELSVDTPGTYSVEEKSEDGWNPVGPECQNVVLAAAGATGSIAGLPPCPTLPDNPFPQPGCDEFNSVATVRVLFTNPPLDTIDCDLSGPTLIERDAVDDGSLDSIDTEIIALDLTGSCAQGGTVELRQSPDRRSFGQITEQENADPGTLEFKAESYFDVFFEVDTAIGTLHNQDPLRMECKIQGIPPYGCFYEPDVGTVTLYNDDKKEVGQLVHAQHIPIDPKKELVIFTNERKEGSQTPTPTSTPTGPTPTPTPFDQDRYSITVLKLDHVTGEPIPGWQMNLYSGGCSGSGSFIASGFTDNDGLIDFVDLFPGRYSVDEKFVPGWSPFGTGYCQEVEFGGAVGGSAAFTCPIADADFPAAGCDKFDSGAQVNLDFNKDGDADAVLTANGPVLIQRDALDGNSIDTEIVSMDLTGSSALGSFAIDVNPNLSSFGAIENITTHPNGSFANGDSFFNVFIRIETATGDFLHNQQPIHMECKINGLPPYFCLYQPPIDDPIQLFNANGTASGIWIVHGVHVPLPPGEKLIVFRNQPKRIGDVNCDGLTTSVDALFILQYVARLLSQLPCEENADTNLDGAWTAVDASLILQFVARFIDQLPPAAIAGVRSGDRAESRMLTSAW